MNQVHNLHSMPGGSDMPFLAASILAVILRLFYSSRLIFLRKRSSYVSHMMKNHVWMNENPLNAIDAKSYFHSYGYDYSKIGAVMFKGQFFTYLGRSCMGFLSQVRGHTILRKRENKFCVFFHHPFWLQLVWHFRAIIFNFLIHFHLARDHWRGFITRNAHMVHIVN